MLYTKFAIYQIRYIPNSLYTKFVISQFAIYPKSYHQKSDTNSILIRYRLYARRRRRKISEKVKSFSPTCKLSKAIPQRRFSKQAKSQWGISKILCCRKVVPKINHIFRFNASNNRVAQGASGVPYLKMGISAPLCVRL